MKKLLLTLLLALTVGVGAASAVEKSYTLTFKTGTNTSTQFKAGADLASNLTEGAEYVTTVQSQSNSFPTTAEGIRVGSAKGAGNLIINLSDAGKVEATKVVFNAKGDKTTTHLNWGAAASATAGTAIATGSFAEYTFELDGTELSQLKIYGWARVMISSITVYYNEAITDPNEIEAPTISNDKGLVTIINNAEGSTIYYSVNNETCDATSTPYTAPFTVEKGDVVRAMAIDGEKASQVVEATITWLKTEYASLAEFIAEKPAHLVTFTCPFTAIYQDGKNLYVTDGTDQILVYGAVNQTYVNGDVIPAGAQGSFMDFNGTYEIEKPAGFGAPESGTPVEPAVITVADLSEAVGNHYVVVKEATLTATAITDATGEAPVQDKFKKNLTGSDVDVYGFVSVYVSSSATKIQIAPVEIQESIGSNTPEQVVSTPAVVEDVIEITRGESVTFTSRYAAKLKIEVDGHEPLVVEGREYVYTPEEEAIVTVTPIGADGNEYAEMSLMVMISFKAAPLCGEVTFDPADGTALFAGSKVTVACENAVKIFYMVGDGEAVSTEGNTAEVTINEACTLTAWGVNADGKESERANASYTIKEADKYVFINNVSDIKDGAQYILLGATLSSKTYKLMGGKNGGYRNAISYSEGGELPQAITITDASDLAVMTINAVAENMYSIMIDDQYLGTVSNTAKKAQDFAYAESATESRFQFEITFDGDKCNIITGTQAIRFNGSNNPNRFKTYLATNATMSPVYLYRLADGEYAAAPEAMYIHGHFPGSYYDFSAPVQMTAEEGGKVFTATNVYIGGNADAEGNPLSYVFSDAKAEGDAPQSYALRTIDWSAINGNVYHKNGVTHTATGDHAEIAPFEVENGEGNYDFTADFSGFSPKFTAEKNISTGVEGITVDTAEAEYFTLQGVRVANPSNGIYIRRQGSTTTKVLVK